MSEGKVYLCKWKRSGRNYSVWVEKRPRLRAEAASLVEACEELGGLICRAIGDGEAVLELDPPRPEERQASLVALTWNAFWYPKEGVDRAEYEALYEGGICKTCCSAVGPRTDLPFPVGDVSGGDLLGTWLMFSNAVLASERFLNLLTPKEQSALEWRPVDHRDKTRKRFFELVPTLAMQQVESRTDRSGGWRCPTCGFRVFGGSLDTIAGDDLPSPLPPLFAIDGPHTLTLAVSRRRWMELRGKLGTRAIVTRPVAVLPQADVVRRPRLQLLSKAGIKARHWELRQQLAAYASLS